MQASINRSVARSKEIVYDVKEGEKTLFRAVILEDNSLLVVYPNEDMTEADQRTLSKLLVKAKHRDGISSHTVMKPHVLIEQGKELVVRRAAEEAIV